MIAIPAIDLREGACVQLVGGSYAEEKVRVDDPLEALKQWRSHGFGTFHVVDLDAALGKGSNADAIFRLTAYERGLTFSVGGGVRDTDRVEAVLSGGAASVVVGTRAIEDVAWLADIAQAYPGRVVVAADVKGREVVTRGWTEGSARDVRDVLSVLDPLPLGGLLVTAVHKEGQLSGVDLPLMREVASSSPHRLYASGGVTTLEDLRALADAGPMGRSLAWRCTPDGWMRAPSLGSSRDDHCHSRDEGDAGPRGAGARQGRHAGGHGPEVL